MSTDAVLDDAFTILLDKARARERDQLPPTVRPGTLNFEWTGGGQPIAVAVDPVTLLSVPTSCDPVLLEVPFPCSIVWAHMWAGDALGNPVPVSATIELRMTQLLTFGVSAPVYGTGLIPLLAAQSSANLSILGWQTNFITGDALTARLATLTGLATWVALTLQIRPTDVPIGVSDVITAGGVTYVDAAGNPYVIRS